MLFWLLLFWGSDKDAFGYMDCFGVKLFSAPLAICVSEAWLSGRFLFEWDGDGSNCESWACCCCCPISNGDICVGIRWLVFVICCSCVRPMLIWSTMLLWSCCCCCWKLFCAVLSKSGAVFCFNRRRFWECLEWWNRVRSSDCSSLIWYELEPIEQDDVSSGESFSSSPSFETVWCTVPRWQK